MVVAITMSILYPYQQQAEDAFFAKLADPECAENRWAEEMATGLGKTVTGASIINRWILSHDGAGQRALWMVHTEDLINQAVETIRAIVDPRLTIGVVQARRDEPAADIVVGCVPTLARLDRRAAIHNVGLVVVDECHHATATSYREVLDHFGAFRGVPTLGLTATLARSDGSPMGSVWQDLIFSRGLPWAVRNGWLVDLIPYTVTVPDMDAGAGDAQLDRMIAAGIAPEAMVQAWRKRAAGRSTIAFTPAVASARRLVDAFAETGVKAELVHGGMPRAEIDAVRARLAAGITTVVCNCMLWTEGFDCPRVSCVMVLRPTRSVPLFVQMVGRGARRWLGPDAPPLEDQDCVVLSLADGTTSLATVANLSDKPVEQADGKSLLTMEDEWDLGAAIEPAALAEYRGELKVERWDPYVQASSKAWKATKGKALFLPTAKSGEGYVFVVGSDVFAFGRRQVRAQNGAMAQRLGAWKVTAAPDVQLALRMAEDVAMERGGDLGALLADRSRPWRKATPSPGAVAVARSAGVPAGRIDAILASKKAGKAGELSDAIDTVMASRVLDPIVKRIREKQGARV